MARDHKPDLMLLDIQMPGKYDGLEVCAELKNDVETSNIYIIMLTAKGQEWDKEAGWRAGCDEYYVKPFSPLELMSKVEQLLS